MTESELASRYSALPEEGRRLVEEFVSLLSRSCAAAVPPRPKGDIAVEPARGMWADRTEMADPDYVRKLRRREWREPA